MKYLELFKDGFDSTINEKIKPENWPYVGYSPNEGLRLSMILEENQSGYQMIDLGLSVKWADRNVGAENPWDNGLYFSWGNVDGHAVDENGNTTDGYSFNKNTYSTTLGSQYTGSTLDAEQDAATVNMGNDWRMPTVDEIVELVENTSHCYIGEDGSVVTGLFSSQMNSSYKGLDGSKLRSICFVKWGDEFNYNDRSNFIEIPFAGYCGGSLLKNDGLKGQVWSSSDPGSSDEYAQYWGFTSDGYLGKGGANSRYFGLSVRGVHP